MRTKFAASFMEKLEKLVNDPFRTVVFFAVLLTIFYTVQCALLQNVLGLDVLEAVSWGAQGTLGNAKHPPLSGWLAYGISFMGNHKDWIMYLAAQLCLVIGVVYIYRTAKLFFNDYAAGTAALLSYFLFYYNPSETRFCTYPVEMMLVPLAGYNFFRALQENKLINWIALGIFCGAGLLNKYSFALVLLAFGIIMLRRKSNRQRLKSIKPYCAALIVLLIIIPHLQWLYEHDFVCLKHVSNRLSDEYKWYTPLVTLATALYPYGMMALVLLLALLPDFRSRGRISIQKQIGYDAALIALIPAAVLVILSFFGDIIMMWFCSMASLTGVMLISFFPWEIDRKFFSRVVVLLALFSLGMMTGTTLDLLCKSQPRVHSDPQSYTIAAQKFNNQYNPLYRISVVVGTRFEATLLEKYLPHHPPACEVDDPVALELYRKKIRTEGALLIAPGNRKDRPPEEIFENFFQEIGCTQPVIFEKHTYYYQAKFGKKKKRIYYLGFLPPQEPSNRKPDNVINTNVLPEK